MRPGSGTDSQREEPPAEVLTEAPERAMIVFAHPDDAEIGAGGTVAAWARAGCEIAYVACTTGNSGSGERGITPDRLAPLRAREQEEEARALGVRHVLMLDHPDGGLEDDRRFRGELVRALRAYRPHTVLTHDPHRIGGFLHRDHQIAGLVTMDAFYPPARTPARSGTSAAFLHFPEQIDAEGLEPHKVRQLLLLGATGET